MSEKDVVKRVKIAGRPFVLRSGDVVRAVREIDPEPIKSHYVVVDSRRFPPKQVVSEVTGLDRADFTTHQARRTLTRLGFPAGRRTSGRMNGGNRQVRRADVRHEERLADRLRPLRGQWVAIKDEDILHTAPTPQALVRWLGQHGQKADSVFRVPEDEAAGSGIAPR